MGFRRLVQLTFNFPHEFEVECLTTQPVEEAGHVTFRRVVTKEKASDHVKRLPSVETMKLKNLMAANAPLKQVPSSILNPSYEEAAAAFAEPAQNE